MNFKYLSDGPVETFQPPIEGVRNICLNPSSDTFVLLKEPSISEVRKLIKSHAEKRCDQIWENLMGVTKDDPPVINLFQFNKELQLANVYAPTIKRYTGFANSAEIISHVQRMTIDEQRKYASGLKPKNNAELLALIRQSGLEDPIGYSFFMDTLNKSGSGTEFFGNLIDSLFAELLVAPKTKFGKFTHPTRDRTLELLTLACGEQILLFPFLSLRSSLPLPSILVPPLVIEGYFAVTFRPKGITQILDAVDAINKETGGETRYARDISYLVLCSTFRSLDQLNHSIAKRFYELTMDRPMGSKQRTMPLASRRSINALLKVRNSLSLNHAPIPPVNEKRGGIAIDEYLAFAEARESYPHLTVWADCMLEWCKSVKDTQHSIRKTACNDFLTFLGGLPDAPLSPLQIKRRHINDMTSTGRTFRNYLMSKMTSRAPRTVRFTLLNQFFDYVRDKERVNNPDFWMANPFDLRLDKFSTDTRGAGSPRKAIASYIMEEMRQILLEDDYAWPKTKTNWGHAVDRRTGKLEYVWCPSTAILLYLLLSIPLRGLQGRMLDSGEGDAMIYDFESKRMVPNHNQLPVDGKIDPSRREGLLQLMPSGMLGVPDLLGMWITTNKTSTTGYSVPWISEDLLAQIKYQRDWILRYTDTPNMHTIEVSNGKRSLPDEIANDGKSYYCLFRDPFIEELHDHSLPVQKHRLARIWGQLCLEAQTRINARSDAGHHVLLVDPERDANGLPKPLFDIHSLRVSGITDLLDRGVPLNIVSEYIAGHATYIMTLWYDKPSPGAMRRKLEEAHRNLGSDQSSVPSFTSDQLLEHKPYLVTHHEYAELYNGFDALEENTGLAIIRHSGICPGTRCSDGGLDTDLRVKPVPMGDRGPSCPQCRFWLTGPAFLLGQTIEGNQLIYKIRSKVESLSKLRERIMDAEDAKNVTEARILTGQQDVEERQLNDMLTEWWHRMRFYEASKQKLAAYKADIEKSAHNGGAQPITIVRNGESLPEPDWAIKKASELDLKHFLSTCAEFMPETTIDAKAAKQDIEIAVAKFLSLNGKGDLAAMYFTMDDDERLTAANLTVEMMLDAARSPEHAQEILEGREPLSALPSLKEGVEYLFGQGLTKAISRSPLPRKQSRC